MKVFDSGFFQKLTDDARNNSRGRQHRNIHNSYAEPAQRLFNAIEPLSYIRPHRHASDPREELLVAMRGKLALLVFDDHGHITRSVLLAAEPSGSEVHSAVELSSAEWHTVIALTPGSVLLEVKAGPFDPERPKDYAPWAPAESSTEAQSYLKKLSAQVMP